MEMIIQGLEGHTVELCADSNGNHVISKCLEIKPEELRYPLYEHIIAHCSTVLMFLCYNYRLLKRNMDVQ